MRSEEVLNDGGVRDGTPSFQRHTVFTLYQNFDTCQNLRGSPFHHVRDDFDLGFSASLSGSSAPLDTSHPSVQTSDSMPLTFIDIEERKKN